MEAAFIQPSRVPTFSTQLTSLSNWNGQAVARLALGLECGRLSYRIVPSGNYLFGARGFLLLKRFALYPLFVSSSLCSLSPSSCRNQSGTGILTRKCSGVADIASTLAMEWRPALDEVLLMSSILLAYVAGIVSPPFTGFSGLGTSTRDNTVELLSTSGMLAQDDERKFQNVDTDSLCDNINRKLAEAVSRMQKTSVATENAPNPKLCLQALAYGPRLRLLLTTLAILRSEVPKHPAVSSLDLVCSMIGPACRSWISKEEPPKTKERSTPTSYLSANLMKSEAFRGAREDEAKAYLSTYLQRSGKVELYTDILLFLCNKSPRSLDQETCAKLAENVLEDIVVTASEGAAAMYLGVVSASNAGWSSLLRPSISSTRSLERFRNEVALQQWIHHNLGSVAAIYEDRMELWTLKAEMTKKHSGPKKRSTEKCVKCELDLAHVNVRLRRSRELKALSGWRYYYSLYLEVSDIVGPLLRMLLSKLGQGLSFLLVCLIGRSFGLIYQGIRQSVKWSSD